MFRGQYMSFVSCAFILISKHVSGEAIAYFPPDARIMNELQYAHPYYQPVSRSAFPNDYVTSQREAAPTRQFVAREQMEPQESLTPVFHTAAGTPPKPPSVPDSPMQGLNYTIHDGRNAEDYYRQSKSGYDYATHSALPSYPSAPTYSYTSPGSSYSASASPAAPSYGPATSLEPTPKFPILKPDLTSLIKPVTTKVATKLSGLIGLVLSLLTGTAPDDLEMKGFKDIIINGIVRPLLIAKGGIKSLISKLTIPVISLLLINLEVLITVWWLWEECPESAKPSYSQPAYDSKYSY